MKKRLASALLALTVVISMCPAVSAADDAAQTVSGFYGIGTAQDVTINAASDTASVTNTSSDVDGDGTDEAVFANSDKLTVTFSAAVEGAYYGIVLVEGSDLPTYDDDIYYINQVTAQSGTVSFDVYPILPTATTDMTLYISSSDEDSSLIEINLAYAVNTAVSIDESTDITQSITITNNTTATTANAVVTPANGKWVEGENTFTVTATLPCWVYVSLDGGENYTRVEAAQNADGTGYDFTASLAANAIVAVGVRGDANGDGRIRSNDISKLKKIINGAEEYETTIDALIADATGDGKIRSNDLSKLKKAINGSEALAWEK